MTDQAYPDALPPQYRLHWYVLERVLGQGGFGITYLARDTNLDQLVAVKEYLPVEVATRRPDSSVRSRSDGQRDRYRLGLDRFIQEARTLARFDHPNIVRVHSVFEFNDTAYMVMRFEEGENLAAKLEQRGVLPENDLLRILLPILDGLELVHNAGFIHRDIKPDNIHIRTDGNPVLLDFGSARHALGKARTLTILVAPGYAPFEQYYSSSESQGPWTDIYGLGATCYRAIAGTPPLDAIARSKGILGSAREVLVSAKVVGNGRYSDRLLAAVDHALGFAEKDRPQSIAEWRREITGDGDRPGAKSVVREPAQEPSQSSSALPAAPASPPRVPDTAGLAAQTAKASIPYDMARTGWSGARAPVIWAAAGAAAAAVALAVFLSVQAPNRAPPDQKIAEANQQLEEKIRQRLEDERKRDEEKKRQIEEEQRQRLLDQQARDEEKKRQEEAERKLLLAQHERDQEKKRLEEQKRKQSPPSREPKQAPEGKPAPKDETRQSGLPAKDDARRIESLAKGETSKTEPPAKDEARKSEPPAPSATEPTLADKLASADRAAASGDYARAIEILKPLAEAGNARAQVKFGDMYAAGRGVKGDDTAAAGWYRKAADQGDTIGQLNLGDGYANGRGVAKNNFQAYIWYSLAVRAGNAVADARQKKMAALLQPAEIRQADRVVDDWRARPAK